MAPQEEPILFLWGFSPWASKVVTYLALHLEALGVKYRRIPLLAIGRDIYCDTLLIIETLEKLYPGSKENPQISASNPTDRALEKLFEKWTDVVVFKPAAACIPVELDLMKDEKFQKDREELWGRSWSAEAQNALRPKGLADLRADFDLLEDLLSDGRKWLQGDEGPKLADIHACWIFDWLFQLPNAYDDKFFNKDQYPKTIEWRERYSAAVATAKKEADDPPELEGKDAVDRILNGPLTADPKVNPDPIGFKEGDEVIMYPIDTGYNAKDSGKLVGLGAHEAVVSTTSKEGDKEIRIHYPRWNFEIERPGAGNQEFLPLQPKPGDQEPASLGTDHVG